MAHSRVALALIAALLVPLTACVAEVTASSRSLLGPQQSGAVTSHSVEDTAREVTRLFEVRGYALVDQHVDAPNGERVLKYSKTNRLLAADRGDDAYTLSGDVGSVFYAWVSPTEAGSTVSVLGKPTLSGVEPCTHDGVTLPCSQIITNQIFVEAHLSAHLEVEVAHGVLSQLALEGYALGPIPASAPPPTSDAGFVACTAARHQALLKAVAEPDKDKKQELLDQVPRC
jgi:hypothetical protein